MHSANRLEAQQCRCAKLDSPKALPARSRMYLNNIVGCGCGSGILVGWRQVIAPLTGFVFLLTSSEVPFELSNNQINRT